MTSGCQVWVGDLLDRNMTIAGDVLELGSLDINGTIRRFFSDRERFPTYMGLDMRPGPGVDLEAKGDNIPFPDSTFSIVITLEMLEHDDAFWNTLRECYRVLSPGGWLIVTTRAFGFPRHDYPNDYWRFTSDGLRAAIKQAGFDQIDCVEDNDDGGIFAVARRIDGLLPMFISPPSSPALMPESEVANLRVRMRSFIPIGITSVADAFERVDSDRRLLLRLVNRIENDLLLHEALSPEVIEQIHRITGKDVVDDAGAEHL